MRTIACQHHILACNIRVKQTWYLPSYCLTAASTGESSITQSVLYLVWKKPVQMMFACTAVTAMRHTIHLELAG